MNKKIREWLESFAFAAVISVIMFMIFWPFSISGNSMEDSFFNGDRIAISRVHAMLNKISAGDFVVCKMPIDGKQEYVLKRVIGMPGDKLEIKEGSVFINDNIVTEDYAGYTAGDISLTLANDEFFVLGDNRFVSYDSRETGPVNTRNMVGKVLIRWYPFDKMTVYGKKSKNTNG